MTHGNVRRPGNLAFAFEGGHLAIAQSAGSIASPTGPQTQEVLVDEAVRYYLSVANGSDDAYEYVERPLRNPNLTPARGFRLNKEKLVKLTVGQLILLREKADPSKFIELRSRALHSPAALEECTDKLAEESYNYWDRLASRDLAYELQLESQLGTSPATARDIVARREQHEAEGVLARAAIAKVPLCGLLVTFLDTARAIKTLVGGHSSAADAADSEMRTTIYSQPDWRVVDRLHAHFSRVEPMDHL